MKMRVMIAPIAGAIRTAGKDGALRFVLELVGSPADHAIASAELYALIGWTFDVDPVKVDRDGGGDDGEATVFGRRDD